MSEGPADRVVAALLAAGLLDPAHRRAADDVVAGALAEPGSQPAPEPVRVTRRDHVRSPLRTRLVELTGYVGGALVVAAALFVVGEQWAGLARGERIALLVGVAVVLAVLGLLVARSSGDATWRRRLASVLLTAVAPAAAGAVVIALEPSVATSATGGSRVEIGGSLVGTAVAAAAYRLAPSLLGQLVTASGTAWVVSALLDGVGPAHDVAVGLAYVVVGAGWFAAAERGLARETDGGRVIAGLFCLAGAQVPLFSDHDWVAYVVTLVVAAVAFAVSLARPAWQYLGLGVAGVTLAVPEVLSDLTGGALGPAAVLGVAGITLLVASLVAARLRRPGVRQ